MRLTITHEVVDQMSTIRKEHVVEQLEAAARDHDGQAGMEVLKRHLGVSTEKAGEIFVTFERDAARGLALVDLHFLRP